MEYRFIKACRREPVDMTPIWIMRQAGRYMAEYRAIRKKVSFLELCKTPELACEVTLQPIDYLGVDAAILFSDILIPVEAMGLKLDFTPAPVFEDPVRSAAAVERLTIPDPEESVPFVMEAIRLLRSELEGRVPLIGFSGSPFTLASYVVEGGGSKSFIHLKSMMFREPEVFDGLMKKLTKVVILYLAAQIEAGAQAVQIFDTWGGILSPDDYARFDLPFTTEIIRQLRKYDVPIIYYAGTGASLLELSATAGADVLGVDWRIDMSSVRERLGHDLALQGNMDPAALFSSPEDIRARAKKVIDGAGVRGHVFNLGHGILPPTPPENAKALVDFVHEYSAEKIAREG